MESPPDREFPLAAVAAVQRLIERWHDRGVVIGGVAASLLGRPRYTEDVDATLLASFEDIQQILEHAAEEGLVPRREDVSAFARQTRMLLLLHAESDVKVDVSLAALPFEEEMIERGSLHSSGSLLVRLPTSEDLIITKAIAHRRRDFDDIEALVRVNPELDRARIKMWVQAFAELMEMPELWDDIAPLLGN